MWAETFKLTTPSLPRSSLLNTCVWGGPQVESHWCKVIIWNHSVGSCTHTESLTDVTCAASACGGSTFFDISTRQKHCGLGRIGAVRLQHSTGSTTDALKRLRFVMTFPVLLWKTYRCLRRVRREPQPVNKKFNLSVLIVVHLFSSVHNGSLALADSSHQC